MISDDFLDRYMPLFGEHVWHSYTIDPTIDEVSKNHFVKVEKLLKRYFDTNQKVAILEIASYAHTTGYMLKEAYDAEVTLFDISSQTLKLGRKLAGYSEIDINPKLVVGDFHTLPFEDQSFDIVYICSALHHTKRWRIVLSEMLRVLKIGGLVFLENEPSYREACFYLFETNRPNAFNAFEKALENTGIIQTVAQPYLGSRPEKMCGMIENQHIGIDDLMTLFSEQCFIEESQFYPSICMGKIENEWISYKNLTLSEISQKIEESILNAIEPASLLYDKTIAGLNFSLPTPNAIKKFADNIAHSIKNLPEKNHPLYLREISKVFGAAISIVARKNSHIEVKIDTKLSKSVYEGVESFFDFKIANVLIHNNSKICNLQQASSQILSRFFPSSSWEINKQEGEITSVSVKLLHTYGELYTDSALSGLLILGMYVSPSLNGMSLFEIIYKDEVIDSIEVWQSEFILRTCWINDDVYQPKTITIRYQDGDNQYGNTGALALTYAGLYEIEQKEKLC